MEKDNNGKVVVTALAGLAAGFILGVYFASPDKKKLKEDVKKTFDEGKEKLSSIVDQKDELVQLKDKVLGLVKEVERKIENLS